jgi:hypothetical protein
MKRRIIKNVVLFSGFCLILGGCANGSRMSGKETLVLGYARITEGSRSELTTYGDSSGGDSMKMLFGENK